MTVNMGKPHQGLSFNVAATDLDILGLHNYTAAFQPIVKNKEDSTYEIVGFESLARQKGPTEGTLGNFPTKLFEHAEAIGQKKSIFLNMLKQAYEFQDKLLQDLPQSNVYTSVNLDIDSLYDKELIHDINEIKQFFPNVPPPRIVIEILEEELLEQPENEESTAHALNNIHKLKHNVGFKIAIDDFGTGASNLKRLCDIESLSAFDILKHDRTIIDTLENKEKYFPSFQKVIPELDELLTFKQYAEESNARIVVEGIENEQQEQLIKKHFGNDVYMQGYRFAKALHKDHALNLMHNGGTISTAKNLKNAGLTHELNA